MIQTIRVTHKNEDEDLKGNGIVSDINSYIKTPNIERVRTVRVYRLEGITEKKAKLLAEKLFCETINQVYSLNTPLLNGSAKKVEVGYKPGVMNPEVSSIIKSAKDLEVDLQAADASWEYGFYGNVSKQELLELVSKLRLFNPTVEQIIEKEPTTLLIKGVPGGTIDIPVRSMSNEQLLELSKDKLFLNLEELHVIQNYFKTIQRDPTDVELETLAQTWSEHCAHKTFKANLIVDGVKKLPLMTRIKKEALKHKKNIVSAFVDNSGVMDFYDGFGICGKAETHNAPSAIEPYGGAMTGSGGVFRDVVGTGRGAKAIASTDIFCFAPPYMSLQKLPSGCLPPDYLLKRVVAAVRDYGNRVGIPTNNGSFHFHEDFRAKPTVLVGAYGIVPKKDAQKGVPKKGDTVVVIGGRTGRDGIHGATFSSGEMTDRTMTVNSSAVQIGNAIEEKRTFDAILEARNKGLIRAIQDLGAGGFSSAIGELGEEIGVTVHLEKAKLKYEGLSPWEIWVSESQERMCLAIPTQKLKQFLTICKKYNVECSVMGVFDGSKKLNVFYGRRKVADLSMDFLHHGLPQRTMIAKKLKHTESKTKEPKIPKNNTEWIDVLSKVLSNGNICSKEPIIRLYDHTVQGTNILQPYSGDTFNGPQNAAVIKPLLDKKYGVVVSHGLNPVLNNIDPYLGSIWASIEALSNYVAVGGDFKEASLINNYIFPFPDEESLWTLDRSVDAVVEIMKTFKIPVISGKDSLSSTYRNKNGTVIKIPPVLCMSVFGKIKDVKKTTSSDFKRENSTIVLVGKLDHKGMGGSVYLDVTNHQSYLLPKIDLKLTPQIFNTLYKAIQKDKLLSIHDISEGGLITTLFEMCVGGDMGATINVKPFKNEREDYVLFNEAVGRFIVEVENTQVAREVFKGIPYTILGKTQKEKTITVQNKDTQLFSATLEELKKVWLEPMQKYFS